MFDGHLTIDCTVRAERGANPDDGDEEEEVMLLMNMVIIWMMSRMMMMNIRMIMMTLTRRPLIALYGPRAC